MGEPFMTVYVVGQLKFTDRAAYERYAARFRGVLKQFGGRLLAADEQPEIIEGRWDRDKIVLLSFSNATAFRGFFESAQGSTGLRPTGIWSRCVRKQTHYAHLEFCRS